MKLETCGNDNDTPTNVMPETDADTRPEISGWPKIFVTKFQGTYDVKKHLFYEQIDRIQGTNRALVLVQI